MSDRNLLRFLTCGSVDDGKSTLIGRLLYDAQLILDDQWAALHKDSRRYGTTGEDPDFALLMDGLEVELSNRISNRSHSDFRFSWSTGQTPTFVATREPL